MRAIVPFIRFGLMNGKYIVKNVRSSNILSDNEIVDILCYQQCKELKCGKFRIKQRIFTGIGYEIPYRLQVLDPAIEYKNTAQTLRNADFLDGCVTNQCKKSAMYLSLDKSFVIKKIEFAMLDDISWNLDEINGATIRYYDAIKHKTKK